MKKTVIIDTLDHANYWIMMEGFGKFVGTKIGLFSITTLTNTKQTKTKYRTTILTVPDLIT